jgi:hypothetical protein
MMAGTPQYSTQPYRLSVRPQVGKYNMMETNKIKEQFHYFNISADIDSVYGNWAVSTEGDVVNCLYPYAILAIHFKDADWMEKMKTKVWFKPECEETLSQALARAKEILK